MPRGGRREGAGRKSGVLNKVTTDVRALAEPYGTEALEQLVTLMRSAENEQVKVAACKEILDRAYGKSPQAVTVDPGDKAVDFMTELLGLIDGKSRGLPAVIAPGQREPFRGSTSLWPHA